MKIPAYRLFLHLNSSTITAMKKILSDRSFRLAFLLSIIFLGTGFAFLHFGLAEYSAILFLGLPIVLGISIGALPDRKLAYVGGGGGILIFLVLLLVGQLEGMICVGMALGVIIPMAFLGAVIVHLFKRYRDLKSTDKLPILLLPLLPFLFFAPLEKLLSTERKQIVEVKTERIYPFSPMQVYDAIKSVDTVIAEKSILMKIDLPIPTKCVLEKEEVGGLRTCHFSGGTITEKITELEKGKVLKMDVIDYRLTGRKWLGFKEAIYYFEEAGQGSCKLTRVTTYTSELTPRLYWEPLEKWGIEQEHKYVLDHIEGALSRGIRH